MAYDGFRAALCWVELSTGDCVALSGSVAQVLDELARLRPAEVLVPEHATEEHLQLLSELAQMFSERTFREQLATADSADELAALFGAWKAA